MLKYVSCFSATNAGWILMRPLAVQAERITLRRCVECEEFAACDFYCYHHQHQVPYVMRNKTQVDDSGIYALPTTDTLLYIVLGPHQTPTHSSGSQFCFLGNERVFDDITQMPDTPFWETEESFEVCVERLSSDLVTEMQQAAKRFLFKHSRLCLQSRLARSNWIPTTCKIYHSVQIIVRI
jgi:hypothetical protein